MDYDAASIRTNMRQTSYTVSKARKAVNRMQSTHLKRPHIVFSGEIRFDSPAVVHAIDVRAVKG